MAGKFEVGEFCDRKCQIDVVGLRTDGRIDLGECKWHGRPAIAEVRRELQARAVQYPVGHQTMQERIFLRARPKSTPPDGVIVHDLAALYGG